jgi:phosphatidylglycerol lysyltransferase
MANLESTHSELLDILEPQNEWAVRLVSAIVLLNGLFAILEVLYFRFSPRLESLLPVDYEYYGRYFGLFAGFLLIYFSSRLLKRKRLAWWIAFVGSLLIVAIHVVFARNLSALLLPSLSLILLAIYHDEFRVPSEIASIRQGAGLLVLSLVIAVLYGTVGFAKLLPRDFNPPQRISVVQGAIRTIREYTLVGNGDLDPRTEHAKWFLGSLGVFGSVSIAIAFLSLFRPLDYKFRTLPQERARAREILERFGTSSEDIFKLWPEDKSYFFVGNVFLAYRVERGVAIVLGEPVGPSESWVDVIRQFKAYCHQHDWSVAFVYVPRPRLSLFEDAGFKPLKIGQDAIVDTAKFMEAVAGNKHFRAVRNKFKRLGYTFSVALPPHGQQVLNQAASVTRLWLASDGRAERGFALGYHDHDYLQRSILYLLRDESGRLEAFANSIQSFNPKQETVDLMRHAADGETGSMDFLFLSIIEYLAGRGVAEFGLGLAPMTGVGTGPERTTEERVAGYLSRLGIGGLSYKGLRKFKGKFEPRWEDQYLLYERGPVGLARAGAAIGVVMQKR